MEDMVSATLLGQNFTTSEKYIVGSDYVTRPMAGNFPLIGVDAFITVNKSGLATLRFVPKENGIPNVDPAIFEVMCDAEALATLSAVAQTLIDHARARWGQ